MSRDLTFWELIALICGLIGFIMICVTSLANFIAFIREELMSKPKPRKCIVHGCNNHEDGGTFVGDLCAPCHDMITTGKVHHANPTFIGDLKRGYDAWIGIANAVTKLAAKLPRHRQTRSNLDVPLDNECLQCRDPNCGLYGCLKRGS